MAVNRCDDLAVGYTASGGTTYPSVWVSGRLQNDPPGTLRPETRIKAGEFTSDAFDRVTPPFRWGVSTGMAIDPDSSTFWHIGQYCKITNNPDGR